MAKNRASQHRVSTLPSADPFKDQHAREYEADVAEMIEHLTACAKTTTNGAAPTVWFAIEQFNRCRRDATDDASWAEHVLAGVALGRAESDFELNRIGAFKELGAFLKARSGRGARFKALNEQRRTPKTEALSYAKLLQSDQDFVRVGALADAIVARLRTRCTPRSYEQVCRWLTEWRKSGAIRKR